MPEMVEADVVERGGGLEAGDVAAELGRSLLARRTIAIAFQRMTERMRRSISRSPGCGCFSTGIVLT
ncbi:MAG: hypothetical protein QM773_18765 [Hyphomonadaceae bacterium]